MAAVLTTIDNPFHPIDQFDEWRIWDESHGYYTLAYLARVCPVSHDMSEPDQDAAQEAAVDEIVKMNINGMYKKVVVSS